MAIASVLRSERDKAEFELHVSEIIKSDAFKGSERCSRFLKFVIKQVVTGCFENVNERTIGVELFGRSQEYKTAADPIVRVTASDVRRRLLLHYAQYGRKSRFEISLPRRTYIPEIIVHSFVETSGETKPRTLSDASNSNLETADSISAPSQKELGNLSLSQSGGFRFVLLGCVLVLIVVSSLLWARYEQQQQKISNSHPTVLQTPPWSILFRSPYTTQIITSDRGIAEIQTLVHKPISLSQYANRVYLSESKTLDPQLIRTCQMILLSNKAAAVDLPIVANIVSLAPPNTPKFAVHIARDVQLHDLQTEGNFIFLGSPRSNPWVSLFNDKLDFRFEQLEDSREFIYNAHPLQHEEQTFRFEDKGSTTGETYAIIAFLPTPEQRGSTLILAGIDAIGTGAASSLVTDVPRLAGILNKCGITRSSNRSYFEMLLRVGAIDGYSNGSDVVACHPIEAPFDSAL